MGIYHLVLGWLSFAGYFIYQIFEKLFLFKSIYSPRHPGTLNFMKILGAVAEILDRQMTQFFIKYQTLYKVMQTEPQKTISC